MKKVFNFFIISVIVVCIFTSIPKELYSQDSSPQTTSYPSLGLGLVLGLDLGLDCYIAMGRGGGWDIQLTYSWIFNSINLDVSLHGRILYLISIKELLPYWEVGFMGRYGLWDCPKDPTTNNYVIPNYESSPIWVPSFDLRIAGGLEYILNSTIEFFFELSVYSGINIVDPFVTTEHELIKMVEFDVGLGIMVGAKFYIGR